MLRIIATIGSIQILAIAVNLIRSKTIAVFLGPEGVGIISVIDQFVMLIVQLSAFSLPFAAVKFLSRSHSESFESFRRSYSNLLGLLFLLSSTGAIIGLGLVFWKPDVLGEELQPYRSLLVLGMFSIPFIPLQGFLKNVLAASQRIKASAFMDVAIAITITTCVCIGIRVKGVSGFYWGNLIAGCLIVAVTLIYLWKNLQLPLLIKKQNIFQELKKNPDVVTFSLIMYTSAFLYPLGMLVARHSIFAKSGHEAAGFLQAAFAISSVINLILNPANGLYLTPIVNRNISVKEKLEASLEFQRKLMIAIGVLAMPMVLFSQWMVVLLFSPSFVEVSQTVFLFIIAQCIIQLAGVYQALMIGLDDLKTYSALTALGHFSFGAIAWLLAPEYGILGVAVSQLISSSLIFGLTLAQLHFRYGLVLPSKLTHSILYSLGLLFLMGVCFSHLNNSPWIILIKLVAYSLFVAGLFLYLTREERLQFLHQSEVILRKIKA